MSNSHRTFVQMDLFSAATAPSHGGYPQTTAGANGTSAGSVAPSTGWPFGQPLISNPVVNGTTVTSPAPTYSYTSAGPNWANVSIGADGAFIVSSAEVNTIEDYSFSFKDNGVDRKAILAPEYDITPLETLKLTRLMYASPSNLNKLQYVKDNNLLRHFRLV